MSLKADVNASAPFWAEAGASEVWVADVLAVAAEAIGFDGAVDVMLADDATVAGLNAAWRGKDAPTNVLAFPAPPESLPHRGDIILAAETVAAEAVAQGKPVLSHIAHLLIHALLHLAGYDHQTDDDAAVMEALETKLLAQQGHPDPY